MELLNGIIAWVVLNWMILVMVVMLTVLAVVVVLYRIKIKKLTSENDKLWNDYRIMDKDHMDYRGAHVKEIHKLSKDIIQLRQNYKDVYDKHAQVEHELREQLSELGHAKNVVEGQRDALLKKNTATELRIKAMGLTSPDVKSDRLAQAEKIYRFLSGKSAE